MWWKNLYLCAKISLINKDYKGELFSMRINRQIFNKIFVIFVITVFVLVLTACPAFSDWYYDELPNDYEICHINTNTIIIQKGHLNSGDVVDAAFNRYIVEFCSNDLYIGFKLLPEGVRQNEMDTTEEVDTSNLEHYLINSQTDEVYGPYTAEEYEEQIEVLNVGVMEEWIKTVPKPDDAKL